MELAAHVETLLQNLLTRGVNAKRARTEAKRELEDARSAVAMTEWAERVAAAGLIEGYARRAAVRSFVTGVPGGLAAIPLAFVDAQGALNSRAELALALQLLVDDEFATGDTWKREVIALAYSIEDTALAGARTVAIRAVRDIVLERGLRFVAKRIGRRFVPLIGGILGAGVTYGWMHREGRRMAKQAVGKRGKHVGEAYAPKAVATDPANLPN